MPIHPSADQLLNGSLETQFVELQGIVTAVTAEGITLRTRAGKIKITLPYFPLASLKKYEDALVRICGCLLMSWDTNSVPYQIKPGEMRMYDPAFEVDQAAPADAFAFPRKSLKDLLLFDARASAFPRMTGSNHPCVSSRTGLLRISKRHTKAAR